MTRTEKGQMRKWVQCWQKVGPILERERREDIRNADTKKFVRLFSGLTKSLQADRPYIRGSGLVEQQAWFKRKI